jgi:hypothetical protein
MVHMYVILVSVQRRRGVVNKLGEEYCEVAAMQSAEQEHACLSSNGGARAWHRGGIRTPVGARFLFGSV